MRARGWLPATSLITVVCLLVVSAFYVSIASATPPHQEGDNQHPDPATEVVEMRTANAKFYPTGPGRYMAIVSAGPIHYQDENGQWQDIDTTIVPAPGGYAVETNSVKTYFPARLDTARVIRAEAEVQVPAKDRTRPAESRQMVVKAGQWLPAPVNQAPATFIKKELFTTWRPAAMRFRDQAGHEDFIASVAPAEGVVVGNVIAYPGAFPHTTEEFQVFPGGFSHRLIFSAPPRAPAAHLSGQIYLEYVGYLTLPPDYSLSAGGRAQKGEFITSSDIVVQDASGNALTSLGATYAYEQADDSQGVSGACSVQPEGENWRLAIRLPLSWLTAPERTYPVAVVIPQSVTGSVPDAGIDSGGGTWSTDTRFFVGYHTVNGIGRALAYWNARGIPNMWMINSARTELYARSGASLNCQITTNRVTSNWNADQVTWNLAQTGISWGTPGGDFVATAEATTTVDSTYPGYKNMGSITDLVAEWHQADWWNWEGETGTENSGVIYKGTVESGGTDIYREFDRNKAGSSTWPRLGLMDVVTEPISLAAYDPVSRRVPSPDRFSHAAPSSWEWRAFGLRGGEGCDYDLYLWDRADTGDADATILAYSNFISRSVELVAINKKAAQEVRYPLVWHYSGRCNYDIEFAPSTEDISTSRTYGPYTMSPDQVLRTWQFKPAVGQTYSFTVRPAVGDADLAMGILSPNRGDYQSRSDIAYSAQADAGGAGAVETLQYAPDSDDYHALVVWSKGATSATTFSLDVGTGERTYRRFLPAVLSNYTTTIPCSPLSNGDFESDGSGWRFSSSGLDYQISTDAHGGSKAAVLGAYNYATPCQGGIPVNAYAATEQCVLVPDSGSPTLRFWYRIMTQDRKESIPPGGTTPVLKDTLDVIVAGTTIDQINPYPNVGCDTIFDAGWLQYSYDLSAYKGKSITLRFEVWNRQHDWYATWAYIDDVTIQ